MNRYVYFFSSGSNVQNILPQFCHIILQDKRKKTITFVEKLLYT